MEKPSNFSEALSPRAGQGAKAPLLSRFRSPLACRLLIVAGLAAYCNSFNGAFVFDDRPAIHENPSIKHLWPIGPVFTPPGNGNTVQGRPLVNLSLAINWAIGKGSVLGYHVVNLVIHLAAGLLLFGIVRRTLLQKRLCERFGGSATLIALTVGLLWTVHPLQTESVTYIVQRAESMMSLFYLLTLYCVIRGAGSSRSLLWYALSAMACLAGMATKEVMVSAPLVVLLYDRTFLAGSFKEAFRRRWPLYAALACTWGLLGHLLASSGNRGGTAGLGLSVTPWQYALTQPGVILHYLRLVFWPTGLVLHYQWPFANTLGQILPGAFVVGLLLAATIWALIRRPAEGFLGACFFLILAPSSSFIPLYDAAFEHRMYLALAPVVVLTVMLLHQVWQRLWEKVSSRHPSALKRALPLATVILAAAALGYGTFQRNQDYRSELVLWRDVVAKRPMNGRARYSLGSALLAAGNAQEAVAQDERAIQFNPGYVEAENNLGAALAAMGNQQEAIVHYKRALQLKSDNAGVENNLGLALVAIGRLPDAISHYQRALQLESNNSPIENNLGIALAQMGKVPQAILHFKRSLQLNPENEEAAYNLAKAQSLLAK